MDHAIFWPTFFAILIAEFGDKTQLAAIAASASSKSTWSVLLAVCSALVVSGVLGVLAGKFLRQWIDPQRIQVLAGLLFICIGVYTLIKSLR